MGCRCVARRSGVDHGDAAPCPSENERSTQAGRSPADDDHVVMRLRLIMLLALHRMTSKVVHSPLLTGRNDPEQLYQAAPGCPASGTALVAIGSSAGARWRVS